MLQVTSIEHLKQLSNINGRAEFYMLLVGGLCRSSKEIHYDEQTKRFDIYNEIDDTYQSNLTEKALHTKTNIPEAIKNGVFYYHGEQLWGI
ncbi:hypothetical protein [Sediminibacterium sp.]|jgi:hypothetical protein|uniref:hypothetical protein n=3 Tax=Sediminibacterium sp. TaxID=1917865 RepID=UPI0025E67FE8|nr:hypothetical protein [Sediminibacterium sp.]MBT9483343.1 hypothetical protein [Sediminibacterium sp.]